MREPVKLVLNRNYRLASTMGHVIFFKKDVPVEVPAVMYPEAINLGAVRADGKDAYEDKPEPPKHAASADERADLLRSALDTLIKRNDTEDFTATGNPKIAAVEKIVSFKTNRKELSRAIRTRNEELANDA